MKQPAKGPGKSKRSARTRAKSAIIAHRRTCDPKGVGLSHYVFVEKKAR
jgi:modified peptide precursor CbpA